ncbi:hypothetical protein [Geodermatophilus sp. DSM 44513]|uniref:hypothetical protein n=1 Tax=Geodermatophilus sp. DSM 44513 TaxID=1528104 RepID=UPI001288D1EA|nr:hypothetical protein [Geodermatophilus sp. DSM 44513]WNV73686.1 hypothetical protein RTG05_11900 [Geodermatophilus sp. DSM 44513]
MPRAPMVAAGVLALGATLLGSLPWPRPRWAGASAWLLADVPVSLGVVVLATAVGCVGTAVRLTGSVEPLRRGDVRTWLWLALLLIAAAALVWNALYAAALSTIAFGAVIPVFHWLFTFLPAVLAGALFASRGQARWSAALGTGVVTVPLFALSWALLSPALSLDGILGTLWTTAVLGVVPLAVGIAAAGAMGGAPTVGDGIS